LQDCWYKKNTRYIDTRQPEPRCTGTDIERDVDKQQCWKNRFGNGIPCSWGKRGTKEDAVYTIHEYRVSRPSRADYTCQPLSPIYTCSPVWL